MPGVKPVDIVYAFGSLHEVCNLLVDFMEDMIDSKDRRVVSARFHLEKMKEFVDNINKKSKRPF